MSPHTQFIEITNKKNEIYKVFHVKTKTYLPLKGPKVLT